VSITEKVSKNIHEHVRLNWQQVGTIHGAGDFLPAGSGIYAYALVRRIAGLPVHIEWKYIGKSKNLRTRIGNGHDVRYEQNDGLRSWLRRCNPNSELWFCRVNEAELDHVEQGLIAQVQPEYNIKHK
jgi:excinuclease UvrABC nuclease subunit